MLIPIPALNDNYIWLYARENLPLLIVDLPETDKLFHLLEEKNFSVDALFITHNQAYHTVVF